MSHHTALQSFNLDAGVSIAQANPWHNLPVTTASPAVEVMTDLTRVKAATIQPTAKLKQAEQVMIYQGVRMLFVVSDMPSFTGLITATDLHSDDQMRVVHDRQLRYDELCVADVMTALAELDAIRFEHLATATVGNVIATLKGLGRHHLLVVQAATSDAPQRVRGVISRAQIERQLGVSIDITPIARSFSQIERALA